MRSQFVLWRCPNCEHADWLPATTGSWIRPRVRCSSCRSCYRVSGFPLILVPVLLAELLPLFVVPPLIASLLGDARELSLLVLPAVALLVSLPAALYVHILFTHVLPRTYVGKHTG